MEIGSIIISIHVPREGDDVWRVYKLSCKRISIHVPREGDDPAASSERPAPTDFYPRPPRGGRPTICKNYCVLQDFYPRPPRGGRPLNGKICRRLVTFLSTSPARGTTANVTENTLHFPATFVTTRYSVQKHAVFLCRMRLFPQRTCTNILKMITGPRCEPSGVFLRTAGSHLRLAARGGRFCTDAFTPAKYRPAPIAARGRRVRPWSCTGCRAGKNAGCPHPGR